MGDFVVLAVLAVIIFLVVRSMVKSHKNGGHCSGCSCGCSNCSASCVGKNKTSQDSES